MGKTKGIGWVILVLGVVFVLGGLAVKFVVLPSQAKFPADVDSTRNYEGELAVMMNAAALETGDLAHLFLSTLHHAQIGIKGESHLLHARFPLLHGRVHLVF